MKNISSILVRRTLAFVGKNSFLAVIIPLLILAIAIAVILGEQGAFDTLTQRSALWQADLDKPLNYRDLDATQIMVLIVLATIAAAVPAYRFSEFLKATLAQPADKA